MLILYHLLLNFFCLMKKLTFAFVMSLVVTSFGFLNAQVFIVEHVGGVFAPYSNMKAATDALQDDDILYIPPGRHVISTYTFSYNGYTRNGICIGKRVKVLGAGYTLGINSSILVGDLWFTSGSSNSIISGLKMEGGSNVYFDNTALCYISRCMANTFSIQNVAQNNTITECVANYTFSVDNSSSCLLSKSIAYSGNGQIYNTTLSNNVLPVNTFHNCNINNNILINRTDDVANNINVPNDNNSYSYNLWVGCNPIATGNCTLSHEIIGQFANNTFVNYSTGDLHLKATSPGVASGSDGTDRGIYGTSFPFKETRLPGTPYFSVKTISSETNAAGKLPVSIVVEAQDR